MLLKMFFCFVFGHKMFFCLKKRENIQRSSGPERILQGPHDIIIIKKLYIDVIIRPKEKLM